jgi:hypothetical protein
MPGSARYGEAPVSRAGAMRPSLRPLIILLAALAVLVIIAVGVALPSNDQGNPSSRSPGKLGTLAMYSWLDRLGLPVHRITGTFDLADTDLMVSYDPLTPFSSSDVDAVMSHLRAGGDAVLAMDNAGSVMNATSLLARLGVDVVAQTSPGQATPAQPFDAADRVRSVPLGGGYAFLNESPLVPLLKERDSVVAAVVRVDGGGRVYLIGDTLPLSNDGLRHDDSEWFVLSLLERARGGRVAFDEFHHGEGGPAPTGVAAIFAGPVGLAAGLAAVVVFAALALNGRRLGRPLSDQRPAEVPSAATYVAAMGQLFSRSRQLGAVASRYADELKRSVGRMTGVDFHLDDAAFVAAASLADESRATSLSALLARARALAASRPDESALLRLARDVDAYEKAWATSASV